MIDFPILKIGSAFYRNGGLYEVLSLPGNNSGEMVVEDLINGGVIRLSLKSLRASFRNRPGELELVPRDIARKEAKVAARKRGKGTRLRGRKPIDLRKAGLHDYLGKRARVQRKARFQTTYVMDDGLEVVVYRRTTRIDFCITEPNRELVLPWAVTPKGVLRYEAKDAAKQRRPSLAAYVDPRAVRDTALSVEYVKQIIEATTKEKR